MYTVEDLLNELAEFPKHLEVKLVVETDDPRDGVRYVKLRIGSLKFEDDEVLIEHE